MLARLKGPGIFLLIALVGSFIFVKLYLNSRLGYAWQEAEGRITQVSEQRIGNNYWSGLVKYEYEVGGVTYFGEGVPLDDFEEPIIWPQHRYEVEKMNAWKSRDVIPILINPEVPAESTTFPDYNGNFLVAAIIFLLMLLLAIVVFVTAISVKRQNRMLTEDEAKQFHDAIKNKYMR